MSGLIEVNRLYSTDLYDTTMDYQDIRISDELIKSQLMWPRMSLNETDSSEDKGKYVNSKVQVYMICIHIFIALPEKGFPAAK